MREQSAGLSFIVVLHCLRPRGTLCGSNNFLTSSCQMQTIPANGMGCVLASCTAAFSFPGLCHVLSHPKASVSFCRDESPKDFRGRNTSAQAEDSAQVLVASRAVR